MFAPELLSLIGGGLMGAITKMWAQSSADKQAIFERLIKSAQAENDFANAASKRSIGNGGEITRRIIILAVLFGVILAPFLLTLIQLPTVVQVDIPVKSFFGIFSWGGQTSFYELYGYLITPEIRISLLSLIGYYFGSSVCKRSNL